ncbi:hypothetical protein GGTG_13211 [Gaeumannomyces tritici R3-111a-1]|uniref:Uncharacterized protein n=1 Tax=Gaeumannomyces tritici (strain R3-111a-1) TaxID=644352 RepID=J3PI83_GAET3|nr:hypothetical protein GGTG_13211 [Gaeumannomyces tritici R3-111a-1]EJT69595.1 hypothetical protein GGTG_13211 [Gaeumannomyces tritici R3-111a-1]
MSLGAAAADTERDGERVEEEPYPVDVGGASDQPPWLSDDAVFKSAALCAFGPRAAVQFEGRRPATSAASPSQGLASAAISTVTPAAVGTQGGQGDAARAASAKLLPLVLVQASHDLKTCLHHAIDINTPEFVTRTSAPSPMATARPALYAPPSAGATAGRSGDPTRAELHEEYRRSKRLKAEAIEAGWCQGQPEEDAGYIPSSKKRREPSWPGERRVRRIIKLVVNDDAALPCSDATMEKRGEEGDEPHHRGRDG